MIASNSELGRLYDGLSRLSRLRNLQKYGRGDGSLIMHKVLRVPPSRGSSPPTYLDDLSLSVVNLPSNPHVLDAGCGFGGTIFRWHKTVGGHYDGITLSHVQVDVARREARTRGIDDACRFYCRSYDDPLPGTYDAVVAIESLIHSRNLGNTLKNFAGALNPGGHLIVIDDMLGYPMPSGSDRDLRVLRRLWHLGTMPSKDDYRRGFELNGLELIREMDLSGQIVTTSSRLLSVMGTVYRYLRAVAPVAVVRSILSAYLGGIALERMHLDGKVKYLLLVGRKGGRG